jgi:hypothetical protein
MMPPKDISASALYSMLSTTPRPYKVVDFPRLDAEGKPIAQVAIRAMNGAEYLKANVAADDVARAQFKGVDLSKSVGYANAYSTALRIEQLLLAVRDAEDPNKPAFPSAKAIRDCLTTEEIGALYLLFLDVTEQIGPVINAMSSAEADAWLERLIEGGSESDGPFSGLSGQQAMTLLRASVSRLARCRTPSGCWFTPPDDTTPENESEPPPDLSDLVSPDEPEPDAVATDADGGP